MFRSIAALLAAVSCVAVAQAQETPAAVAGALPYTLDQAVAAAGGSAPAAEAAQANVEAARAARTVAGLRPNPTVQTQVENIAGSGPYSGVGSAESTVSVAIPIELGGKRSARIAVANAQTNRALLVSAITQADIRLQVTQLYVEAVAAERRVETARDQSRIAGDAANAASVRVKAGRASPIEEQRANVAKINADAELIRTIRLAQASRANLARRIGQSVDGPLDTAWLERLPHGYGPDVPPTAAGTLALAAADADLAVADANVRLARSQRVPDLEAGPGVRRLSATNDTALIFTVTMPIPIFNSGRAAVTQARAQRNQVEAQKRMTALDIEQAITDAQAAASNAAVTAQTATGPALEAAREAARIARIGYREGKFSQLDLLDAERTLAQTRLAAIDALTSYQNARAQLERLTAPAPEQGN
ncbi:TolC family protein [Sphingomonas sp. NPDC019816]|jgi:cobalt-zinc-cadmium efflux system outer membrane protein|uniref:Transporter n=2 Tax=Sphingobium TaxID=165695 RepID=A0A8E1C208_9SPHN|nr:MULTISPECIES: TolC family protein [Alphaproteobacteria]MDE0877128.1 TolC family protein [Sphingomonas bacterium]AYO75534.1 TolC family protein [Sphingobium yanoikuyae]KER35750.1 transporter [Sphingobium indicum F2]MDG2515295.1 TolC family protein [Sphingobium yanoikuyae]MDG5973237.1 TolC family protein [Sphingomonas paucimobilis]|tara:strand:+ start:46 stop:1308 length:1263 start_codon:yes stop_codon:yes gene_type:complete